MKNIVFKDLAFVNLLIVLLINIIFAYLLTRVSVSILGQPQWSGEKLILLIYLAAALLITGIIFIIISIVKGEKKDFRYHFCIWGYPIFILLSIVSALLS